MTTAKHPRIPPDAGAFFLTLSLAMRQVMVTRYGDGRELGMGEAIKLYLVHQGELPLPRNADALRRLDALRDALTTARSSTRGPTEAAAHG